MGKHYNEKAKQQAREERADVAAAKVALAEGGTPIPLEEIRQELKLGAAIVATEIRRRRRVLYTLDPQAQGPSVSVRLVKGCKVVEGPWGSKALQHPDFVITKPDHPRLGKAQTHSLEVALATGYAQLA